MKRFVWLLLIAFCSALAQVQPVDAPVANPQEDCGCCENQANACGMPDCVAQPVAGQPAVGPVAAGQQAEAPRLARAKRDHFFVQFLPRPALTPAAKMSVPTTPPARAPLFKAHCSFLI
jgi:hypothetical protein